MFLTINSDKLAPHALKFVPLSYSRVQKGYCCYSPDLHRYLVSGNATFFETWPYFAYSDHRDISKVLPIPTFEESVVAPPTSPATTLPLLTYHHCLCPVSDSNDSCPASDPTHKANLSPHSPLIAL